MNWLSEFAEYFFIYTALFASATVLAILLLITIFYVLDRTQTKHAVRRNYPIIGRFRYWFEHLGEFFRQYFFAMDREEMPFNRAQRSWVYRAAKNLDNTIAFGSTRDVRIEGSVMFVNAPFPPLTDEAEPASEIVIGQHCKYPYRTNSVVNVSGMSYGAISKPAVQALSHGAKEAGCWLNIGEGGLSSYHLEGDCDLVYQIGTAKYGVRDLEGNLSKEKLARVAEYPQIKMFEIKLSQGAKPSKGGILPAAKVNYEVAKIRGIPVAQDSHSPNRHREIESNESLLDMIEEVRSVTGKPTGFKAVISSAQWLDDLFDLIKSRGIESAPDFIAVDSADGGTGAAPMSLMDDMGITIKESLPMLIDALYEYGLRDRVKVIASGKLINPTEVAWAMCVGCDFVATARGAMFALGCIQALQCNKNTCPTGVTTHDKRLQQGLVVTDKKKRVAWYIKNLEKELRVIANSCGVKDPRKLRRHHARVVVGQGKSVTLSELYPLADMYIPN